MKELLIEKEELEELFLERFEEATKNMWDRLTDEEKEIVKAIPNFDENKFKEITGIQI